MELTAGKAGQKQQTTGVRRHVRRQASATRQTGAPLTTTCNVSFMCGIGAKGAGNTTVQEARAAAGASTDSVAERLALPPPAADLQTCEITACFFLSSPASAQTLSTRCGQGQSSRSCSTVTAANESDY